MAYERLPNRLASRRVPHLRHVRKRSDDALSIGAERCTPHLVAVGYNEQLEQIAQRAIELQLRLGHISSSRHGGVGQCLKRKQHCDPASL